MSEAVVKSEKNSKGNHAARLAAVQALYQMDLADRGPDSVVKEFLEHRLVVKTDQPGVLIVNRGLFEEIVRTTYEKHTQIDTFISESLPSSWSLDRLDAVLRAILRAGCGEFLMDKNLAAAVIIDEYINVARDFFSAREPGFVNGVLDHIAHVLGLKMKDEPEAKIKDFTKDYNTSGVPNWEDEGGSND
jgi:transcription antitermination protein NusB